MASGTYHGDDNMGNIEQILNQRGNKKNKATQKSKFYFLISSKADCKQSLYWKMLQILTESLSVTPFTNVLVSPGVNVENSRNIPSLCTFFTASLSSLECNYIPSSYLVFLPVESMQLKKISTGDFGNSRQWVRIHTHTHTEETVVFLEWNQLAWNQTDGFEARHISIWLSQCVCGSQTISIIQSISLSTSPISLSLSHTHCNCRFHCKDYLRNWLVQLEGHPSVHTLDPKLVSIVLWLLSSLVSEQHFQDWKLFKWQSWDAK